MIRRKIAGYVPDTTSMKDYNPKIEANLLRKLRKLQTDTGIYPLTSPGIPALPANSDFLFELTEKFKMDNGEVVIPPESLEALIYNALYTKQHTHSVEVGPLLRKLVLTLPGHMADGSKKYGPQAAEIMMIGKMAGYDDLVTFRHFSGLVGDVMRNIFELAGFPALSNIYITNLIKFAPPDNKSALKASWIKDGLHLLWQEIKIVQPKYIICMGSEASKALLGSHASVSEMSGRTEILEYNTAFNEKEIPYGLKKATVFTVPSPRAVFKDTSLIRQLENEMERFVDVYNNNTTQDEIEHFVIGDYATLLEQLVEIEADSEWKDSVVAVDAEWHGQHPVNADSYMRTIQFAWRSGHAVGIKLHLAGGKVNPGFVLEDDTNAWGISNTVIALLNVFFRGGKFEGHTFRPKRVVGHFFNADLEWLVAYGIDLRNPFMCPLYDLVLGKAHKLYKTYRKLGFKEYSLVPAWFRTKYEGGADTGLMYHAIEETASYKLENLAMRYTTAPRYDRDLQSWKIQYCKEKGMKSADLEGYGECPDSVLLPYGMYDADVTLRMFYKFDALLDSDYDNKSCREAFWESQIATPAVLEIHRTGIMVDRKRVDLLTQNFMEARDKLNEDLKEALKWPEFKIRSLNHMKEFMFGTTLNGKINKSTGRNVRLRPDGAKSLELKPIFDTSKPPKLWIDVEKQGTARQHSPSTSKQSLSLLAQQAEPEKARLLNMMRDYRFLDQVLKTLLRPPMEDKETEQIQYDTEGNFTYDAGLASMCCDDDRVRTHIYQTKETGRWSSARPNLQNISKQRDPDYKRLLGDKYKHTLRSILKAAPGHVLVEADYVGAELFGMAVMAGDEAMISHATRNQLPEDHPDFYDIHSNVAVNAFKLTCPPTKKGLDSIGKLHIRIVAKSVIFGIAYGRGAKAISVAAKETGTDVSQAEAQAIIDAVFTMYPKLRPFFAECQDRARGVYVNQETQEAVPERVICNCFGRLRRFPDSQFDQSLAAEFGRQAMNFPIQSMIASAVSRALGYMHAYKRLMLKRGHDMFNIVLQIHDAVLLEVPDQYVKHVCEHVLPKYMRDKVSIYPTDLEGNKTGAGPYNLGIEVEVMTHWGEKLTSEEATARGLPTGTGGFAGCVVKYSKG